MRNLYIDNFFRSQLTQGSIISGCVAEDYPNAEVNGLVITPRCDLDHGIKVSTIHYLPIVKLDDWLRIDCAYNLKEIIKKDAKSALNNWFKDNYHTENFLDTSLATKEIVSRRLNEKKAASHVKNQCDLFFDMELEIGIRRMCEHSNSSFDENIVKRVRKIHQKYVRDLSENKVAPFYLIEDWQSGSNSFHVIILREVHQITKNTAEKYKRGFFAEDCDDEFYIRNSLNRGSAGQEIIYEIVAEMKSPFIEHVLQRYAHNFTRIGVEDFDFNELAL